MHPQGETFKANKKMLTPTLERNYFFIDQAVLINFAVATYRNNFFSCKLKNFFFNNTMDGPSGITIAFRSC